MPTLPAVPDDVLLKELIVVVTHGWELPRLSECEASISHLLELAEPTGDESYFIYASRFLNRLNEALECSWYESVPGETNDSPYLSRDEAEGLQILFGVHEDYHVADLITRRNAASARLRPRPAAPFKATDRSAAQTHADSFRDRHEAHFRKMALQCLRYRWGQDKAEPIKTFSALARSLAIVVGPDRRIVSKTIRNVYRSRVDGLTSVVNGFRNGLGVHLPDKVTIEPISGVDGYILEPLNEGRYRLRLHLAAPVNAGERFEVQYTCRFDYQGDDPNISEHGFSLSAHTQNCVIGGSVAFQRNRPSQVWHYSALKILRNVPESTPETVLASDEHGIYSLPEGIFADVEYMYGIKWRW